MFSFFFMCNLSYESIKTAVWRRYVKSSLKCFHRACFERSYFHSIAGLPSWCYFACESQLEYEMDQVWHIAASWFTSQCVCVCEREKDRQTQTVFWRWGVREKHRVPPFLPNNRVLHMFLKIKLDLQYLTTSVSRF